MFNWIRDPLNPPSGAIPRFPIWEVTAMIFSAVVGVVGILTPDSASIIAVLGPWSHVWNVALILSGTFGLFGLAKPAPNGLVINLGAMILLFTSSLAVVAGIAVFQWNLFFPGSISLYVFTIGAGFRGLQLISQLNQLKEGVARIAQDPRRYR